MSLKVGQRSYLESNQNNYRQDILPVTASRVLKYWNLSDKQIMLIEHSIEGIKAFVKTGQTFQEVKREWIEGLPLQIQQAPSKYKAFFNDTYIKLTVMGNGELKLVISSRLKGGMMAADVQGPNGIQGTPRLERSVLELLHQIIPHAQQAHKKDVVAFIGPTGAGKSTMVNHLLGKRMVFKERERRGITRLPDRIEVEGEEIAHIGHGRITSETIYAQTYPLPGQTNQAIVDCGGFYDTRGLANEITVVTSVKLTLEAARSVKLAICCEYATVMATRATGLTELVQTALGGLLADYQANNAVLFLITKPTPDLRNRMPTAETVVEHIRQIIEELGGPGSERSRIYQYIIRENGRYVVLYNPEDDRSRVETFNLLKSMDPIRNTQNAFNPAYSAQAGLALLEEVVAIAVIGNQLFRNYFYNHQQVRECINELNGLNERIGRIESLIAQLGQENVGPEVIRQSEERLRRENQEIVRQAEEEISRLTVSIEERNAALTALNERLSLMDQEGENVESYWTDAIDQEGINIESITTVERSWDSSGFLGIGADSGSEKTTDKKVDKRSIERDFNYRGPEIDHIVKDPTNGNYWSNENQTSNAYSIRYTTGKGEPAKASITVFVKKKHFPEQVHQRLGLVQEIGAERVRIHDLSTQINEQERRKHAAQLALNTSGNKIERLKEYERGLAELQQGLQQVQERRQRLEQESAELVAAIRGNQPDFNFLKDYLHLSHDRRLQGRETVQEFLRHEQRYQQEQNHE